MSHVLVASDQGILSVRLNRPDKKNALSNAMFETMIASLNDASGDADIFAVVFATTGDDFSVGRDIAEFAEDSVTPSFDFLSSPAGRFIRTVATFEKPVVSSVKGLAVGIGTTLLLHSDVAYVARDAKLSAPFASLGLAPEAASSRLMPLTVGYHRAYSLFALGSGLSGAEAVAAGLGTAAVAKEDCDVMAFEAARRLAALSPSALRDTKAIMRPRAEIEAVLAAEAELMSRRMQSADAKEAFSAFREKRKPNFRASAGTSVWE